VAKVTVKLTELKDFEPMTIGVHTFTIVKADIKASITGDFNNIFWELECVASEDATNVGKKVPNYCTTCKPDATYGLTGLRQACGYEDDPANPLDFDTDDMLGNTFQASTKLETAKEDDTKKYTRIDKFIF
jgi:hypothetical protein